MLTIGLTKMYWETYVSDLAKAESRTEKAINKFIAAVTTE